MDLSLKHKLKSIHNLTLKTNYSQQLSAKAIEGSDKSDVPHAPQNTFYLALDYRIKPIFLAFILIPHTSLTAPEKQPTARNPIDDYWLTTLNLRYIPALWPLTASLHITNLFDSDIREPSNGIIVNDYPMPSRQLLAQLEYKF